MNTNIDEKWIELGIEFCNIKNSIDNLCNCKRCHNKAFMRKYFDFEPLFIRFSSFLDDLVCKYYPIEITTINGYLITSLFYCCKTKNKNDIKTVEEIESDVILFYNNFINFEKEHLKNNRSKIMKFNKFIDKLIEKLEKIK